MAKIQKYTELTETGWYYIRYGGTNGTWFPMYIARLGVKHSTEVVECIKIPSAEELIDKGVSQ